MAKKGKYAADPAPKKKHKPSTQQQSRNRNTSQSPRPKKPTPPQDETVKKTKPSSMPELEREKPVQPPQTPPKKVIKDDEATMTTIGLSVEEIIREINIERPDPQAYVHQSDGSATANAVEFKNPRRQRQQMEQEAALAQEPVETPIEPVSEPEIPKSTIDFSTPVRRKPSQTDSTRRRKPTNKKRKTSNRPRKEREPVVEVYDYEYSIKQAERDGTIAGLYCLLFIGLIAGAYAILSKIFPVISVDSIANGLIEIVFMAVVGEGPIIAIMDILMAIVGAIAEWIMKLPIW